jgi:hypothetical protein
MKLWFSMTESEKKIRSLKCAFIMFILTIISLVVLFYYERVIKAKIDKCTVEAEGTITNFYSSRYGQNTLSASFQVNGTLYHARGVYHIGDFTIDERLNAGVPVKVWYEEGNPKNCYAYRPPFLDKAWYMFPVCFGLGFISLLVQARNPSKMEAKMFDKMHISVKKYKGNKQ